jgi:ribosome maturation factor RimP
VDQAGVVLAVEVKGKPGAKKKPPTPRHVPWAQLGLQVEFGRHGEHDDEPGTGDHGADDGAADDGGGE